MKDTAIRAQNIVMSAAEPTFPGERLSVQKRRAFNRLRLYQVNAGWSKLHNAWNARAGWPTLKTLEQQADRVGLREDERLRNQIISTMEALRAADEDFYGPQLEALGEALRGMGGNTGNNG